MIDEIIEAINEKKYDFLYKKLDPTYATAIFPKQENFEKYMEALTAGCNDFTCNYYDVQYYGYQCQLISQSQGVKFEIQMEPANNYTDYYFSPRKDLVETREKYVTFSVNGIIGVIEYEFVCGDTIEYITNLKNNTNRSITCNFSESTAQVNDWGYLIESKLISPVTELSLAAGESKDVTFVFDVKSTDDLRPDFLNFICKVGENTKTARVYISSYEDDIGI